MLIIADSSALIALAVCDGMTLLDKLFEEVKVPKSVFDEVVIEGKPLSDVLRSYLSGKTVSIDLTDYLTVSSGIGQGELEAMALYKKLHADYLLIDDRRARKVAQLNLIKIIGSLGMLLQAKHEALVPSIRPFLDRHSI